MRKLLGTAAGLALALALPVSTAWAQAYPPANSITVDKTSAARGETLTGTARCFQGPVTWRAAGSTVGTSFPNAQGVATISFVVGNLSTGSHTLSASGHDCNGIPLSLATVFSVRAAGGLTPTGSQTIPWLLVGFGSVAVGSTFVGVAKRRGKSAA